MESFLHHISRQMPSYVKVRGIDCFLPSPGDVHTRTPQHPRGRMEKIPSHLHSPVPRPAPEGPKTSSSSVSIFPPRPIPRKNSWKRKAHYPSKHSLVTSLLEIPTCFAAVGRLSFIRWSQLESTPNQDHHLRQPWKKNTRNNERNSRLGFANR